MSPSAGRKRQHRVHFVPESNKREQVAEKGGREREADGRTDGHREGGSYMYDENQRNISDGEMIGSEFRIEFAAILP